MKDIKKTIEEIEEEFEGGVREFFEFQITFNEKENPIFDNLEDKNITKLTGLKSDSRNRFRELVRIRDDHTCQLCGKKWKEGERRFDTHHIDGSPENTKEVISDHENLVTLCHRCHLNVDAPKMVRAVD